MDDNSYGAPDPAGPMEHDYSTNHGAIGAVLDHFEELKECLNRVLLNASATTAKQEALAVLKQVESSESTLRDWLVKNPPDDGEEDSSSSEDGEEDEVESTST